MSKAPGVQFWQFPDEEGAVLDLLASGFPVMAFPARWVRSREEMEPRPLRDCIADGDPDVLWVGPEPFARAAEVKEIDRDGERFFTLGYYDPCLVCYTRGRLLEMGLTYSNFWTYWKYRAEGRSITKPTEFRRWAEGVFRKVRKLTLPAPEGPAHRRTRRVADAVAAGTIRLI